MQTIYLNTDKKNVIVPLLHAKQGDIGRKFLAVITNAAGTIVKTTDAQFSMWYSGASGAGNYTEVNGESAFTDAENGVVVELIPQMLVNKGNGKLCLMLSTLDGDQLATWNIPYCVEEVPGMGSQEVQGYFRTIQESVQQAQQSAQAAQAAAAVSAEFGGYLYDTLSTALSDINANVTDNALEAGEQGRVKVSAGDTGVTTVTLLDDVAEIVQLDISKDITLVLNGHVLSFTDAAAYLNVTAGSNCVIDGTAAGSAVYKNVAADGTINLIRADNEKLVIRGGNYTLTGATATALPLRIYSDEFEMYDATVICEAAASATNSRAFQTSTKAKIENCTITAAGAANPVGLYVNSGDVTVTGCVIDVSSENTSANAFGIRLAINAGESTVTDTKITVTSSQNATGYQKSAASNACITNANISATSTAAIDATGLATGVENHAGIMHISGSTVFTDARGGHGTETTSSVGIYNQGTLFCGDTNVTATHNGCQNNVGGQLYVSGGIFKGVTHGGIYLNHGADGIAYIRDATLRCGDYEGQFGDEFNENAEILAAMYVGSDADNTYGYLDGCIIRDNDQGAVPFVLKGTGTATGQQLYISNTTITNRPRVDDDSMMVHVGIGTNITEVGDINGDIQPQRCEFTGDLYRKHHESEQLTGKDFAALVAYQQATEVQAYDGTVTVV